MPLAGAFGVTVGGVRYDLVGRGSPLAGPTDVLYVPCGDTVVVSSTAGGRFALAGARAEIAYPVQYVAAGSGPVFVRGAGARSREVRDFGGAGTIEADRLIAVEVLNPAGTWSGIPRHKHDTRSEGVDPRLQRG